MSKTFRIGATLGALAACVQLTSSTAHADVVTWIFNGSLSGTAGAGQTQFIAPDSYAPSPSLNFTVSGLSRGNNNASNASGNTFISNTAAGSFPVASSNGNNASTATNGLGFSFNNSAFFEFSATPSAALYSILSNDIKFYSRSSGTGPSELVLYASQGSSFNSSNAVLLSTNTVPFGSGDAVLVDATNYNYKASAGAKVTFRLYGYSGGNGNTTDSNWRIDDLQMNVGVPEPGTFSLALLGAGPLGALVLRRRRQAAGN